MHARYRLYRSCGFGFVASVVRATRLHRLFAVVALVVAGACGHASPVAPTSHDTVNVPMVDHVERVIESCGDGSTCADHNIPAIALDGVSVVWVCRTQPRAYTTRDGVTSWERDHYISSASCPTTPID